MRAFREIAGGSLFCSGLFGGAGEVVCSPLMQDGVDFGSLSRDVQIAVGDAHEEALEERSEQVTTDTVRYGLIQPSRFLEEIDVRERFVHALLDPLCGLRELFSDGSLSKGHELESLPKFLDVQRAVGGKVDEPLFLGFKLAKFLAERFLFLLVGSLELFECATYFASNRSEFFGVEALRGDDTGDGCLDII